MIASGFRRAIDVSNQLDFGLDSGMNVNDFDYAGDGMDSGLPDFPIQFPGRSGTSTVDGNVLFVRQQMFSLGHQATTASSSDPGPYQAPALISRN